MHEPTLPFCGRLRLQFSRLKNDPRQLTALMEALRAVPGVIDIEASPFSGGLLVRFEHASADSRHFWDDIETTLVSHGLHHNPRPLARHVTG